MAPRCALTSVKLFYFWSQLSLCGRDILCFSQSKLAFHLVLLYGTLLSDFNYVCISVIMYICVIFVSLSLPLVSALNNAWINECLQQISVYCLTISVGQEFSSSLRVSHEVTVRISAGLKSFEAQLRLEDSRWFLHLPGLWCWLLAWMLGFFPWGPFMDGLSIPHHAS